MEVKSSILFLFMFLPLTMNLCSAQNKIFVGGKDGWVEKPKESYDQWARRLRFSVRDSLVFRYKRGEDSVLEVNKQDYDACNTKNPIKKMEDGFSVFPLDRSGSFFFISGNNESCKQGEKLWVVVLAERSPSPSPSPSPTPSPLPSPSPTPPPSSPPKTSPPSPAPSPPSAPNPSPPPPADQAPNPPSTSSSPAMYFRRDLFFAGLVAIISYLMVL